MKSDTDIQPPAFFSTEKELPAGIRTLDTYNAALRELFFIEHPKVQKKDASDGQIATFVSSVKDAAVWVYYPWRQLAVKIPSEDIYFRLRTARNRDLITEEEQRRYRASTVGVAGLSVGSAALASLVGTGGPKTVKLADPDTIELTNLNRMRAALPDMGANKSHVAARAVWELDPFADIRLHPQGLSADTLDDFLGGEPALDVFVDEMDDIALKFEVRLRCRKHGIPVVMATDNGDGAIVDIERFDLERDRPIFHGRVEMPEEAIRRGDRAQFVELANRIIDPSFFTVRQLSSLQSIGRRLSGVPQLSTAASIAGAAVAYAVRLITTGGDLPSGRYVLSCEESFAGAKPISPA
jgi:hypothetical protein